MKISICKNYSPEKGKEYNNSRVAYGWESVEVPWEKKKIVDLTIKCGISGNEFSDGHKVKDSWIGTSAIMLDFDDGKMTADQLLSKQSNWNFNSYAFSSQNHQKQKGSEPACDRLRVLIPLDESIRTENERFQIERKVIEDFPEVDPGFMGKARYFAHGSTVVSSFIDDRGSFKWKEFVDEIIPIEENEDHQLDDHREIQRDFLSNGVSQGDRDNACFQAACTLRDCGYSREEAFILLKIGADKCDPPFDVEEVQTKLISAYSYRSNPFAFIEATTSAYYYFNRGKLFAATKDILKETFKAFGSCLPDKFPILEFKFDVHDNLQIDLKKRTFNLFRPTEYHLMERNDMDIIPEEHFGEIQRLLKNLIPKKKERNYFINWLAAILQTRKKLMTSFVFIGPQGAGKGVFLSHILKPLFGDNQTIQVEDEQLKSSFNGWIKNVAFIAFNEVAHDNRGRNSLNSKIKSIITDPSITVNEKNIRTYQLNNNINCIFYSNEKVPLLVERSDRRFTIMETGGNLANKKWFKVPGSFKKFQKELPEFAQYLWNYDVNMKEANKPFSTDLKDVLISAGQSRWEEFVHHLKDGDKVWFQEMTQDIKSFYLTGLFNDKPKFSSAQHVSLDWDHIKKEKYLTKDQALRLFQELYRDKGITKNSLSRHLAPFGFRVQRKGTGDDRMQYYDWN
ncbi:MAG: hypothetical protein HN431_08715 [Bacteroidetes bacterium]|nr:hypothetical protein [Bacteroidota bacterium]